MGTVLAPVRRRILAGAFVASLALALLAPVAAFAANTASFSSRTPASGSWTIVTRPTISIIAYDRYGIRGTGAWKITIDGTAVPVSATYLVHGSWNPSHPDYRRVRLTGRPPSVLTPGTHKITVKIHDRKHRNSTTSWSFTVKAPVSFSSATPANGSRSATTRPTISVNASSIYGAKGAGKITMTVDGSAVTPVVTYTTKYTKFKVARPALTSDLSVGTHTVAVGVTDVKGNLRSYTWTFTTLDPPLLPMPGAEAMDDCASCHSGYPAAHPMDACSSCHDDTAPPRHDGGLMGSYLAGDQSAHLSGCVGNPSCHRGGGAFPHVLDADCARCHTGTYAGIPGGHPASIESAHQSSGDAFCVQAGCHVVSLTYEHYRRTSGGVHLSCSTCHESTDPDVRAAIDASDTGCTSCHDMGAAVHPDTATEHATPAISCTIIGCHTGQAELVHHGKCQACHGPDMTAFTTTCTACHAGHDHTATPVDAVIVINGTSYGSHACDECHASFDLATIHGSGGSSCVVCHPDPAASASPWLGGCVQGDCHSSASTLPLHGNINSGHIAATSPSCTAAQCHSGGSNVAAIHNPTAGKCATCHEAGGTPTIVCATAGCHSSADSHPVANPHPAMTAGHTVDLPPTCVTPRCHQADLAALHTAIRPGHTAPNCAPCHGLDGVGGILTKGCTVVGCHTGDVAYIHSAADPKHAVTTDMCETACHTGNLANIHGSTNCLLCHDGVRDLAELPSTACQNCHTPWDVPTIHAFAGASHNATNPSCVKSSCHVGDVATLHGKVGGPGCEACHAPDKTATLVCGTTGCHPGDVTALHSSADSSHTIAPADASCAAAPCHSTNVATIHAKGPNCDACHGEGKTPSNACAASTCHKWPNGDPKTWDELHVNGQTAHVAESPRCASGAPCHSPNVDYLHQDSTLSCGACHGADATPSVMCADCHSGLPQEVPGPVPTHASAESSHTASGSCVAAGCHITDVSKIHAIPGCETCHGAGHTATLVCTTSGCHSADLAVNHATGNLPHTAPEGYCTSGDRCHAHNAAALHANALNCATCHSPGSTPTVDCTTIGCHDDGVNLSPPGPRGRRAPDWFHLVRDHRLPLRGQRGDGPQGRVPGLPR